MDPKLAPREDLVVRTPLWGLKLPGPLTPLGFFTIAQLCTYTLAFRALELSERAWVYAVFALLLFSGAFAMFYAVFDLVRRDAKALAPARNRKRHSNRRPFRSDDRSARIPVSRR